VKYCLTLSFLISFILGDAQVWQHLTNPSAAEIRKNFRLPPLQYAQTMDFGLGDNLVKDRIAKDIDSVFKQGIRVISIEGNYNSPYPYLSAGYMEGVQMVVSELKKHGMHLWIIDEGKYPSGFAGGLISQKAPEYRMQGIVVAARIRLKDGEAIHDRQLAPEILSAVAENMLTHECKILDIGSGKLDWPATAGEWTITLVDHRFKTSVTRAANNPTHGKDTVNSLIDYLNPAATRKFMEFTHEQYKKYVGDEFGKTILGFRGDEPEYNFTPWTPRLLEVFKEKKGYDIKPYLAAFFSQHITDEQMAAKADFWDVWSDMFRDNFFKVQADWCEANKMEYMVHVNHEEKLMDLARSEGDYFKTMRYVQVPGVDAIWHQIWYDNVADFPKLASSAAHMYGRPRSLSESFAAYTPAPTVDDARWVVNEQMVRGINLFEWMHWGSKYIQDQSFPALSAYVNRATWLLANGRPTAKVAVYCPTESMWFGYKPADSSLRKISRQLLEHQIDFDYIDRQGITSVFTLTRGGFTNASGQLYTTILIPAVQVLYEDVVILLKDFTRQGGKVMFMGALPTMLAKTNFLKWKEMPSAQWASKENFETVGDAFFQSLPHDVLLNKPNTQIKYVHRALQDAELYFFFNESDQQVALMPTVEGWGKASFWDADTGMESAATGTTTSNGGRMVVPMSMPPFGTKFLLIEKNQEVTTVSNKDE